MTMYAQLLDAVRDTSRPYLTQLTPSTRTELSVATFRNGAIKAANALIAWDCEPGSVVAVHLPWHWQRAVWCAGAWLLGVEVAPWADQGDVILADPKGAAHLFGFVAAVSLHPLGLPEAVPPGTEDAVSIARGQPDVFLGAPAADGPALRDADRTLMQSDLASIARDTPCGQRVGVRDDALGWISPVWLPVVHDTSVVMIEDGVDVAAIAAEGLVDG